MDNIQLVCTLNLNHSQGRFQLNPRLISLLRVAAVGYAAQYLFKTKILENLIINVYSTESHC
jgi:hypothetical protein